MITYKCDCCGEMYDAYHCVKFRGESVNSIRFQDKYINGGENNSGSYDICPRCMKAILDVFKEGAKK